jgi:hypothetical protein
MEVLHVYAQEDIDKALDKGVLNYDVYIHGDDVSLEKVSHISGYLGFSYSKNIDLGNVITIGGDLWISSYCNIVEKIDLKTLETVFGGFRMTDVPLHNLGIVNYIGGDLDIRNTMVKNVTHSLVINGNAHLPNTMRDSLNDDFIVVGKTKFYKLKTLQKNNLQTSEIPIPLVKNDFCTCQEYDDSQTKFLNYLIQCFDKGKIIDVKGNISYIYALSEFQLQKYINYTEQNSKKEISSIKKFFQFKDHSKQCNNTNYFVDWLKKYKLIIDEYPRILRWSYEKFFKHKLYAEAWELLLLHKEIRAEEIGLFEEKLNKKLFSASILSKLSVWSILTSLGKQHKNEVVTFAQKGIDEFEEKWGQDFLKVFVNPKFYGKLQYQFYKQFYISEDFFEQVNSWDYQKHLTETYEDSFFPHVVHCAINEQIRKILLEAEDKYRESIGVPKIGENWISETRLYYAIKAKFAPIEVVQHASPKWLGRQHLDVYIPMYNIALEYQGVQHYRPVEFFGGEEAFLKTRERDLRKREKCIENNCELIYVDEGYEFDTVVKNIQQIIASR